MNPKRKKKHKKGAAQWMVTYSDMVTLILVFFILLFSISQIDAEKFRAVAESYQNRAVFDFMPSAIPFDNPSNTDDEALDPEKEELPGFMDTDEDAEDGQDLDELAQVEEDTLDALHEEVEGFLENEELNDVITASRTDRGIVLVLQERVLFESGEAELIDEGLPFLTKVATLLENIPNHVKVEGHTDSRPINNYRFPSNWELSGARASSVIRYFIEDLGMDPARFEAAGYADTRPYVENDGPDNWRLNRRVEIILLRSDQ